jgi:hypothetical protein
MKFLAEYWIYRYDDYDWDEEIIEAPNEVEAIKKLMRKRTNIKTGTIKISQIE